MTKITTASCAFLDVKTKIMEGKVKAQDITKALNDAIKIAESDYEQRISQSVKEQRIKPIAEQDARSIVSSLEAAAAKMCLLTTVTK